MIGIVLALIATVDVRSNSLSSLCDVGGDRDVRRRVFLQDDLPGAALMVRVGVGMEEAECDGADVERFDAARRLAGACLVKRAQTSPV